MQFLHRLLPFHSLILCIVIIYTIRWPTNGFLILLCAEVHSRRISVHSERFNPSLWDIIVVTITFWIKQASLSLLLFNLPISSKAGGLFAFLARLIDLIRKLAHGPSHHFYTAYFNFYLWRTPFFVCIIIQVHNWHRYDAITFHKLFSYDCCFIMNAQVCGSHLVLR